MSITFKNKPNILLWTFEKIIYKFHKQQYLFALQCIWWISALVGLQHALFSYLYHQRFPCSHKMLIRNVSAEPRDIQMHSLDLNIEDLAETSDSYFSDSLQHTQNGQTYPPPQTKTKLKTAQRQANRLQANCQKRAQIWERINLHQE
jgi:hypothetical protein